MRKRTCTATHTLPRELDIKSSKPFFLLVPVHIDASVVAFAYGFALFRVPSPPDALSRRSPSALQSPSAGTADPPANHTRLLLLSPSGPDYLAARGAIACRHRLPIETTSIILEFEIGFTLVHVAEGKGSSLALHACLRRHVLRVLAPRRHSKKPAFCSISMLTPFSYSIPRFAAAPVRPVSTSSAKERAAAYAVQGVVGPRDLRLLLLAAVLRLRFCLPLSPGPRPGRLQGHASHPRRRCCLHGGGVALAWSCDDVVGCSGKRVEEEMENACAGASNSAGQSGAPVSDPTGHHSAPGGHSSAQHPPSTSTPTPTPTPSPTQIHTDTAPLSRPPQPFLETPAAKSSLVHLQPISTRTRLSTTGSSCEETRRGGMKERRGETVLLH
ncbi:hypothetical protein DFH08DRAFT_1088318, partial [Mycena albidolilacea]